ncbi:cysteine proteinase [Paxillus ammoniavirescens]|nr:cysteine proteinase [Paxillus ammoniavirescens]
MGSSKKHQRNSKALLPLRTRTTRSKGRPLADPEHNTQLLTEQLRSLGLYAAHTLGDGNCLFRALCDQLYGTPSHHLQLRKDICDWIESHSQRYEPFCEDERGLSAHLHCMREQGTYGGHLELSAFAHFARRNVKVIQPGLVYVIEWNTAGDVITDQSPSTTIHGDEQLMDVRERRRLRKQQQHEGGLEEEDANETIYVAYHNWEHFSSIRNLRGPHTGLPNVRELPTESEAVVPSPAKKKPLSSRAKSKPESKVTLNRSKNGKFASTRVTIAEAAAHTPTYIPLPMSRSPSPLSSVESLPQIDVDTSPPIPITVQLVKTNDSSLSPTLRTHRSPKRTFDESSGSSSLSDAIAKRTRSSKKPPPSRTHVDPVPDAIEIDDPEEEESTPELSTPGCSVGSTHSSSAASSPLPSTPPPEAPSEPLSVEKTLTRRQRKALGLPKTRAALAAKRASTGKILIPGGRFKRSTRGTTTAAKIQEAGDDGADDEGSMQEEEWQRNGTGRLDVRGFRELKI